MIGAPSQLDLYVDKPKLREMTGELCPEELFNSQQFAFIRSRPKMYGSQFKFRQFGESGQTFSELIPEIGALADDIAVIETMHGEQINHSPAQLFMQTGFGRFGRPSMGSWVTYGLGSENENLPSFVVVVTGSVGGAGNSMWGSGFLPTIYQGVEFRASGDPVLFLSNPRGVKEQTAGRSSIRLINSIGNNCSTWVIRKLPLGLASTRWRIKCSPQYQTNGCKRRD